MSVAFAVTASGCVGWSNVSDFKTLLNRIAAGFPSHRALATALGVTPSRLSRAMTGTGGEFPFNVTNCLRLAQLSGESASEILRAAGKKDVADLIEALYGSPADTLSG